MIQANKHNPFAKTEEIKLTEKERALLRNNILSFIRTESVRQTMGVRHNTSSKMTWMGFLGVHPGSPAYRIVPAVLVIAILISGGTTFAAQSSLPGDILYPIKVDVTEKVQGALTVSDVAKAEWEAELAQRRLVEAEELAAQGRLNEKNSAEVKKRLTAHTTANAKIVSKLNTQSESESAAKVSSSLEASLEVHEKILSGIEKMRSGKNMPDDRSDAEKENDDQIQPLLNAVRADLDAVMQTRLQTEADMSTRAEMEKQKTAERTMRDARTNIRDTESFVKKNKNRVSEEAYTQSAINIELARKIFATGEAQIEKEEYGDAFTSFQESIRASQRVKISIEAAIRLEARTQEKRLEENKKPRQDVIRKKNSRESGAPKPTASPTQSPKPSESSGSFLRRMAPSPTPHLSPEVQTKIQVNTEDSDSEIRLEVEGTGSVEL